MKTRNTKKREAEEIEANLKRSSNESINSKNSQNFSDSDLDDELDKSFNLFQNFLSKNNSSDKQLLKDITITEEDKAPLPSENKYKFSLSKLLRDKEKSNINKANELLKAEEINEDYKIIDYNLESIDEMISLDGTDRVKQIIKEDIINNQVKVFRFFNSFNLEALKSTAKIDQKNLNSATKKNNTNSWLNLALFNNSQLLIGDYQSILLKINQKDIPIDQIFNWSQIKEDFTKLGLNPNLFDNTANLIDFLQDVSIKNKKLGRRELKANNNLFPNYYLNLNLKLILQLVKLRKSELSDDIIEELTTVSILMLMDDTLLKHYDTITQLLSLLLDSDALSMLNSSKLIILLTKLFPTINTQSLENLDWLIILLQNLSNSKRLITELKYALLLKAFKNCCKFECDQNEWKQTYDILDINAIILPDHNLNTPFNLTKQTNYKQFSLILKLTNLLLTPRLFNPKQLYSIQKLGDYLHGLHGSIVDNRASNLDKTLVKDQLQTLYLKLYYYKHHVKSNNLDQMKITDFF